MMISYGVWSMRWVCSLAPSEKSNNTEIIRKCGYNIVGIVILYGQSVGRIEIHTCMLIRLPIQVNKRATEYGRHRHQDNNNSSKNRETYLIHTFNDNFDSSILNVYS